MSLFSFALIAIFLSTSCGTEEKYNELQSSISEVEKNADKFSPQDWGRDYLVRIR
jgi:hypothetical protein